MILLDVLLGVLPEGLVGDPALHRLRVVAAGLPDILSARVGLEVRMDHDPRVDLLAMVSTTDALAMLATAGHRALGADPVAGPGWRGAARLAERSLGLLRHGSDLPPGIWLEFDLATGDGPLVPAVFAAVAPERECTTASRDALQATSEVLAVVAPPDGGRSAPRVPGAATVALLSVVRTVADAGLALRQVGLFPHRPDAGLRLFCAGPSDPVALTATLLACGWPGPVGTLRHWAEYCAVGGGRFYLDLDATPRGLTGDAGIEVLCAGPARSDWRQFVQDLLARLETGGLCCPEKRSALLELAAPAVVGNSRRSRHRYGLHHVKVSLASNGAARAKAYVGIYEMPLLEL